MFWFLDWQTISGSQLLQNTWIIRQTVVLLLEKLKKIMDLSRIYLAVKVKVIETGKILSIVDTIKLAFMWVENMSLIKQQLPFCRTRNQFKFLDEFSKLIKYLSDVPKSETFVYFTKRNIDTWSNNRIIPVSIALVKFF